MPPKQFAVYVISSAPNGTLYTGSTSNPPQRIAQHKQGTFEGFTKKYNVNQLVWFELHENAESAITRERQIKEWQRDWKCNLIERDNPHWDDLYETICN